MNWLSRWKGLIITVCFLAAAGGAGWFLFTKGPLGPVKVTVAKAQKENLKPSVFGIGTVEAKESYTIGPTQAGRVLKVFVDQGDQVQAGQILGEMDPVDLAQQVQSASAAVAEAQNNVALSAAQVQSALSQYNLAQTEADRYSKLLVAHAIDQETVDEKENAVSTAKAALDAAQASLAAARGKVAQAESDREAIVSQQANLNLISPANGIITSRDAEPGTTVVAGQAVFHLVDPQSLWVQTRIDQAQFFGIAVGQPAAIVLRSRQNKPIPGKVLRLEVQGDDVTEERFVDVSFNEVPGSIPLGDSAEVTIALPTVADALAVPSAAVKRVNKQYGVWIVKNGKLQFQPVKVGVQTLDGQTQIISGLNLGDNVVVYSPKQLTGGMKVRVGGQL